MPLGTNVGANMRELSADNRKSGAERGASGVARSRKQMVAIAMSAAGRTKGLKNAMGKMSEAGKQHMKASKV